MLMMRSEGWSLEAKVNDDCVKSKLFPRHGKVFHLETTVNISPEKLLDEIHNLELNSKWNKGVKSSRTLKKIDKHTDVVHIVSAEGGGGLVKSRDFVLVRTWKRDKNSIISAYTNAMEEEDSFMSKNIRGEQGPSAFVLTSIQGEPQKCHLQWIQSINLNNKRPEKLKIDSTFDEAMQMITSDGWKSKAISDNEEVQSKIFPKHGELFCIETTMDVSPEELLYELHHPPIDTNKEYSIKCLKVLEKLDEKTDIAYLVTADYAAGLVASRDFIMVRSWKKIGNSIVYVYVSTNGKYDSISEGYIRGEQLPSIYILTPVQGEPKKCHMKWMQSSKLFGWLPEKIVNQCVASVMLTHVRLLQSEIENKMSPSQKLNK